MGQWWFCILEWDCVLTALEYAWFLLNRDQGGFPPEVEHFLLLCNCPSRVQDLSAVATRVCM